MNGCDGSCSQEPRWKDVWQYTRTRYIVLTPPNGWPLSCGRWQFYHVAVEQDRSEVQAGGRQVQRLVGGTVLHTAQAVGVQDLSGQT